MKKRGYTNTLIICNLKTHSEIHMVNITSIRVSMSILFLLIPQTALSAYTFTAPPRETSEKGYQVYDPIAKFLTKSTGYEFVYKQQSSWGEYIKGMRGEQYDLVFDGPHFVDWRIHEINHHTLLKIPHLLQWRIITRKDNTSINKIEDLIGQKTCAPGSPNFGMLNLFSHFKDSTKQPVHVEVKGWNNVYQSVKSGDCVAGILPKNHLIFDEKGVYTKSIHTHLPYPNQAFTASQKIPESVREKIRSALLSEEGHKAMENLRKRYTGGTKLVSADDEEYDSIYSLLIQAKSFNQSLDKNSN